MAQVFWNFARSLVADLMAGPATIRLQQVKPLALVLHIFRNAVAFGPRAGELAFVGHVQERKPIDGRVVFRGSAGVRRQNGGQVNDSSGSRLDWLGIHEPVAAHPYFVVRLGKLRHEVAAPIVSNHNLHELGRKVGRFRNDPDPTLRTLGAVDHTANVVVSAMTQTPPSGPLVLLTTPPMSSFPIEIASPAVWACSPLTKARRTALNPIDLRGQKTLLLIML